MLRTGRALALCAPLLLVVVTPGAAFSTTDPLTQPTMGFGAFLSYKVPSYDGTLLHVDVQLPDGEGPFPLILEYTPYSILFEQYAGADGEAGAGLLLLPNADFYVPRGYAVGIAHVRGTGESGGCLTIGGPEEGLDGYSIVEFLAAQAWSNKKVAMKGASYVGTTPIETAIVNPPHLTTILPMSAVTDWYRYYFENGEQRWNGDLPPGSSYPDGTLWAGIGLTPGFRTGTADATEAACHAEFAANFYAQDDRNAFWEARDHGAKASNISIASVLYTQGWNDENVASSMISGWFEDVPTTKRAFYQQHGHGVPSRFAHYYAYEHRWLDHFLMDRDNGALDLAPVIVQDPRLTYRAESTWPPADASPARYFLRPSTLAPLPPVEGSETFVDVGNVGGSPLSSSFVVGVDVLAYESEPLLQDAHLAGAIRAHLEVTSNLPDTQFTILVYDVSPNDRIELVTRGHLDARHRTSLATGQDVVPGERTGYGWPLHPQDHVFAAGHRIAIDVKSSDPYVQPDETRAINKVHYGAEGSWIELPLIPTRRVGLLPPLPASWT